MVKKDDKYKSIDIIKKYCDKKERYEIMVVKQNLYNKGYYCFCINCDKCIDSRYYVYVLRNSFKYLSILNYYKLKKLLKEV